MQSVSAIADPIALLTPIAADKTRNQAYGTALANLQRAQTYLNNSDYASALKELLKATDDLMTIAEASASQIRGQVDQVIRAVEQHL